MTYELVDEVAWLTIDNVDRGNALSRAVRAGLWDGVRRFNDDSSAKVLVVAAAGDRVFCAGGDLKEMSEETLQVPPPDYMVHFGRNVEVRKPTIACVNGAAFAGGFMLVQMCDLAIASTNAKFAISEVKVGRGVPWAVPLPDLIHPRVAHWLTMTGLPIDAEQALRCGLVNEIVAPSHLRDRVQEVARVICQNAPLSVTAAKQTMAIRTGAGLEAAFEESERIWEPVYNSRDAQEGPRAFAQGRSPEWSGA
ncbi:MAG: enoyl-CoA hydratase/isomerase family protein [Actinomycetota bacterium]